ncbi:hypothetical protein JB92DRAFT_2080298 [Gautieria morchelliformis]|nr:hypothetical protein JB92DRAFT_2080298 [Gautieria morchelliformis]
MVKWGVELWRRASVEVGEDFVCWDKSECLYIFRDEWFCRQAFRPVSFFTFSAGSFCLHVCHSAPLPTYSAQFRSPPSGTTHLSLLPSNRSLLLTSTLTSTRTCPSPDTPCASGPVHHSMSGPLRVHGTHTRTSDQGLHAPVPLASTRGTPPHLRCILPHPPPTPSTPRPPAFLRSPHPATVPVTVPVPVPHDTSESALGR